MKTFQLNYFFLYFLLYKLMLICCTEHSVNENMIFQREQLQQVEQKDENKKLTVTLFYETQCGDCIEYFAKQLKLANKKLSKYFKLDLVPYGNAKQTYSEGRWHFTCQHGASECKFNKLHACALEKVKSEKTVFNFLSCLMKGSEEQLYLDECAKKYNVNKSVLDSCYQTTEGDELLAKMGNRTHSFRPEIRFVPTVAINNKYSDEYQDDLCLAICKKLKYKPKPCKHLV